MPPFLLLLGLISSLHSCASTPQSGEHLNPTVTLSYGKFQGSSSHGIDNFLGIPFAQAERFGLPQRPKHFSGVQQATSFGPACPQQNVTEPQVTAHGLNGSVAIPTFDTSEDCLSINVIKPFNISATKKLPVLFWIYGGGFEITDTSDRGNASDIVARSIALGEPIIFVSANYRLNAFGFLASKEVKAAGVGNLGLRDQRFAMQWIQENIATFGGDPDKVTIWGQSAGAISVGLHMLINGGDPGGLFRGAFMESGSPMPYEDITTGQPFYDQLVVNTNCSSAADTFACLKHVPFKTLQNAINESPSLFSFKSLQLVWEPRVDGDFLVERPQDSITRGAYAKVPMITGDVDDEGTLFSLTQVNLTTDKEATDYLHHNYFPRASDEQFQLIAQLYPSDPTQGSPFDTGEANQLSPQFKRIAAVQGDVTFQAPRRFFLKFASKTQDTWSFLYKRGKSTPFLGAVHGSDLFEFYGSTTAPDFQGTDVLVNFVNNLDPNMGTTSNQSTLIYWPKYSTNTSAPPLLTFLDPNLLAITSDTYRAAGMEAVTNLSSRFL